VSWPGRPGKDGLGGASLRMAWATQQGADRFRRTDGRRKKQAVDAGIALKPTGTKIDAADNSAFALVA